MMKDYERRVFEATVASIAKASKLPLLLGWLQRLQDAGMDVGVAAVGGVAAKFAEFCHDSENIDQPAGGDH
eukprot:jgi/Tetstr1/460094/TSEL_000472.t1